MAGGCFQAVPRPGLAPSTNNWSFHMHSRAQWPATTQVDFCGISVVAISVRVSRFNFLGNTNFSLQRSLHRKSEHILGHGHVVGYTSNAKWPIFTTPTLTRSRAPIRPATGIFFAEAPPQKWKSAAVAPRGGNPLCSSSPSLYAQECAFPRTVILS